VTQGADGSVVTVLVVDDQEPFRDAAKGVVAATPGFELLGEADSGERAVEIASSIVPDLVLMDINMTGMSGIDATRLITEAHPDTVTFLVSTYEAGDLPATAQSCGATAYINKEDFGPQLLRELWVSGGDPDWARRDTDRANGA
jgi:DNA-binding NarL/FixJ family response regulator